MQSVVRDKPFTVFEGMLSDAAERMVSGIATEMIYSGKAVSVSATVGLSDRPRKVQRFTSGQVLHGIAAGDLTLERLPDPTTGLVNGAPYGAQSALGTVEIVRKGRLWVRSADAVDSLSKSVFIRNADDAGTPAYVDDTTSYPVADQDGNNITVQLTGFALQTITFAGTTTSLASVLAQVNQQLVGGKAYDNGSGQMRIASDTVGAGQSIVVGAGTSGLTFDTPVAGTGNIAILAVDSRGSFRATAAANYTEFAATSGLRWIGSKTENGIYYGELEINLV